MVVLFMVGCVFFTLGLRVSRQWRAANYVSASACFALVSVLGMASIGIFLAVVSVVLWVKGTRTFYQNEKSRIASPTYERGDVPG